MGGKITYEEMNAELLKNEKDIPEDILCVHKCEMDKSKSILDGGNIDVQQLLSKLTYSVHDMDGYKACLSNIKVNNCADFRKVIRCSRDFFKM
ncbi:hypothetical protein HHI36_021172 [Cryptolaemus montrouzieri]|uniref:Uncharacterized protein n=1 Tax=Cryptolaemus montrouzieri TaxID=559131 RepID=A0ABD2MVZ8_9CUCU